MAVLIDASILIECERGRLDLASYLGPRRQEAFFLFVVTANVREFVRVPGLGAEVWG